MIFLSHQCCHSFQFDRHQFFHHFSSVRHLLRLVVPENMNMIDNDDAIEKRFKK